VIEGERVRLRAIERADLPRWREWINDPEIAAFVDRILPVTQPEHESFFETAVMNNPSAVWFAIEDKAKGEYVGNVWLWNIDTRNRRAEVRIIVGERRCWGGGYGSEALALLARYAFDKAGLHKVYAFVMERNPRARAAFHKAGFLDEARLVGEAFWDGTFHDVWRLYRLQEAAVELPRS